MLPGLTLMSVAGMRPRPQSNCMDRCYRLGGGLLVDGCFGATGKNLVKSFAPGGKAYPPRRCVACKELVFKCQGSSLLGTIMAINGIESVLYGVDDVAECT